MLNHTFCKKKFLHFFLFHIKKLSSFTKILEEASNKLNLKVRKLTNKLNNSLIDLEILTEEININK